MSGYVDTREGWRELDVVEPDSIYQLAEYNPADGSVVRAWVREAPVPPLPTEPYTVIETTGIQGHEQVWVLANGMWLVPGEETAYSPTELAASITGFEVLAEPRAVTAKAILDRVQQAGAVPWGTLNAIAHEFGAES